MQKTSGKDRLQEITELRRSGLLPTEIANRLGLTTDTIFNYFVAINKGFSSYSAYQAHLLRKKGFESRADYNRRRGYSSAERRRAIAELKGTSVREIDELRARRLGYASLQERNREENARKEGFESYAAYRAHLAQKKFEIKRKREIYKIILRSLIDAEKDEMTPLQDIAERAGIDPSMISKYYHGHVVPKTKEGQARLLNALSVPYGTLDETLKILKQASTDRTIENFLAEKPEEIPKILRKS